MRGLLTILILLTTLISCGQTNLKNEVIKKTEFLDKELKKELKTEFEGGDVWGTILTYSNNDSTSNKIIIKYNAGDYGQGESVFYLLDHKLIFVSEIKSSWIADVDPDKNQYEFSETKYYFSDKEDGLRENRKLKTKYFEFDRGINELKNQKFLIDSLTVDDYILMLDKVHNNLR